ncbi:hypothetical protein SCANM63S_07142 [Streptomyces canarius]
MVPVATTVAPRMIIHRSRLSAMRSAYPQAMTAAPSASVIRGPRVAEIRADSGENSSMVTPPGSRQRPVATMDRPRPYPVAFGACTSWAVTRELA